MKTQEGEGKGKEKEETPDAPYPFSLRGIRRGKRGKKTDLGEERKKEEKKADSQSLLFFCDF